MYFVIYKTINILNGKYYIGKHQTSDLNDSYLGSGIGIKQAIKKYGRENFRKEVLFLCVSEEEMNQKERELVTEVIVKDDGNYNMRIGGEGGGGVTWQDWPNADDIKKQISVKLTGMKRPEKFRQDRIGNKYAQGGKSRTGQKKSIEERQKLSVRARNREKINCIHCGILCDLSNHARWHGDNCKMMAS